MNFVDRLKMLRVLKNTTLDKVQTKTSVKDEDNSEALVKFQETFNNSNKVSVAIITKKLATGIDLNRRVCAMHLVDIPYTPEIEEQFMGRAVRQGNEVKKVNVYRYNTNGTFDEVKREILKEKSNWQRDLLENIADGGANEIENNAIDQDEVIAEAIERFGVNFTKDDVTTIIQEKKDKQAEAMQKEREFKKNTIKYEFKKIQEIKNLIENEDYRSLTDKIDLKENYSESASTYKIKKEKDFMTKYKIFLKKTDEAVKKILNTYNELENLDKTPQEYKEQLEQIKIDFFNNEIRDYQVMEYDRAYRNFQDDKIVISDYNAYSTSITIKNPLTPVQKKQLEKLVSDTFDNYITAMVKKYEAIKDNEEIYKTTIKSVIEVVDDDEKPLYEALLNDEAVVIDGEVMLKKDTIKTYDLVDNRKEFTHYGCMKFDYKGKEYYVTSYFVDRDDIFELSEIKRIEDENYERKPDNFEEIIQRAINILENAKEDKAISTNEDGTAEINDIETKNTVLVEKTSNDKYVKVVTYVKIGRSIKDIHGEFISNSRDVELDTIIHQYTKDKEHYFYGFDRQKRKVIFAFYEYDEKENYGEEMTKLTKVVKEALENAKRNGYYDKDDEAEREEALRKLEKIKREGRL